MLRTLLLVGIGGAGGSILRYLVSFYTQKSVSSGFPYGTLVVNLLGCLLIGLIFGVSERFQWFSEEWRMFLAVGFCGGFTTFSAFALENVKLLQAGNYSFFLLYTSISILLGLFAVVGGMAIAKI